MSANCPLNTQPSPSEMQGVRASDPAWSGLDMWAPSLWRQGGGEVLRMRKPWLVNPLRAGQFTAEVDQKQFLLPAQYEEGTGKGL